MQLFCVKKGVFEERGLPVKSAAKRSTNVRFTICFDYSHGQKNEDKGDLSDENDTGKI